MILTNLKYTKIGKITGHPLIEMLGEFPNSPLVVSRQHVACPIEIFKRWAIV